MLGTLDREDNLFITRTNSGKEYVETLNRIKFFISADVGMGEYMIKNFEAMAAGCVLFAWNQGEQENRALGFKDMDNVVLYSSIEEFRQKIEILRKDEKKVQSIARNGQNLVESRYGYGVVALSLYVALQAELRKPVEKKYYFFQPTHILDFAL